MAADSSSGFPSPHSLPLFAALSPAARDELVRQALTHSVSAGTVLFEQGEIPSFQHIVLAGSVHLFARSTEGKEVLIEVLGPGDPVIPAAVITGSPYLMQARVMEPSRFLLIPATAFRAALEAEPALARAMIASLAEQFRRMVRQIKSLKLRSAAQRVACYVLALARRQGSDTVRLPYEKNLIASELGVTRESFSRALAALQAEGIRVEGDVIVIEEAKKLTAACSPDPLIDPQEENETPAD